jgi:hypothetical protein
MKNQLAIGLLICLKLIGIGKKIKFEIDFYFVGKINNKTNKIE